MQLCKPELRLTAPPHHFKLDVNAWHRARSGSAKLSKQVAYLFFGADGMSKAWPLRAASLESLRWQQRRR